MLTDEASNVGSQYKSDNILGGQASRSNAALSVIPVLYLKLRLVTKFTTFFGSTTTVDVKMVG